MNISEWKNNFDNININNNIKNLLINFFANYHSTSSLDFFKLDNSLNSALNNINNYKPITIAMDIEFQQAIIHKDGKYITSKNIMNHNTAKFIRELGILIFIKDENRNWYYIGHLFVNFPSLESHGFAKNDLRIIETTSATVTQITHDKMKLKQNDFRLFNLLLPLENQETYNTPKYINIIANIITIFTNNHIFQTLLSEDNKKNILGKLMTIKMNKSDNPVKDVMSIKKQLFKLQYEIHGQYLIPSLRNNFNDSLDLYWNDSQVKGRVKILSGKEHNFIKEFNDISNNSVFVLKGMMDIIGFKNTAQLLFNKDVIQFDYYYDISIFNGFSSNLFKSAQLEDTFYGLIKTQHYNDKVQYIFNRIKSTVGDKAHNPVVDSLFTIIVAIIINIGLNKCFTNYGEKYVNYKRQYSELKNSLPR